MVPFYKTSVFWSMVAGVLVSLGVGIGYQKEAEMIGALAAIIVTYLAASGIITKTEINARINYGEGYRAAERDAKWKAEEEVYRAKVAREV